MTTTEATTTAVVSLTDEARALVTEAMAAEPGAESLALWLEVRAVQAGAFVYDLYFQSVADAGADDSVATADGLTVVIPERSIDRLRGARLEVAADGTGGLVLVNPNQPTAAEAAPGVPPALLEAGLDGVLARTVAAVLEADVNPSIASHGGRCELVAVDEEAHHVYVALSGGCQGCAMSRMTLSQGIEATLRQQIPDLGDVIDVTDHAVGENPYY